MKKPAIRIKIEDIRPSRVAIRAVDRNDPNYKHYLHMAKGQAQLGAIMVRKRRDRDYYEIIDGLSRYTAAKEAGHFSMLCVVVDLEDDQVLAAQIQMSKPYQKTPDRDYCNHLKRILCHNPLMTAVEMSLLIQKPVAWIERIMLKTLHRKILERVRRGDLTLMNAYALSRMPGSKQLEWLKRAVVEKSEVFIPAVNKVVQQHFVLRTCATKRGCKNTSEEYEGIYSKSKKWYCQPCVEKWQTINHDYILFYTEPGGADVLPGGEPVVLEEHEHVRPGWDNVIHEGQPAYLRGDVLVYRQKKWEHAWYIKHPVLHLKNDFNKAEYAMAWVERNLNG